MPLTEEQTTREKIILGVVASFLTNGNDFGMLMADARKALSREDFLLVTQMLAVLPAVELYDPLLIIGSMTAAYVQMRKRVIGYEPEEKNAVSIIHRLGEQLCQEK